MAHQNSTTGGHAAQLHSPTRTSFSITPAQAKRARQLLFERRVLSGLRQQDVANHLNISREFYGHIELGKVHLPLKRLAALAGLLNIDPKALWPLVIYRRQKVPKKVLHGRRA